MPEIQRYQDAAITRGISRQVSRTLARIEGHTNVDLALVEAAADVLAAKVDAATAVTQRALQGAAYITNVECTLGEATPAAMARLKLIGDTGTMTLQQIALDSAAKLRRI